MSQTAIPASGPMVLRIGVVLGGKIMEERMVRPNESVTIGQSAQNTVSVPLDGLPRTFTVLAKTATGYELRFSSAMDGRVSEGNRVSTLDQLRAHAQRGDDYYAVPLRQDMRGKLTLGEFTLLFQFVPEPPPQPKPVLPAAVRGTLLDRLDPLLSTSLAITNTAALVLWIYAFYFTEPPRRGGLASKAAATAGIESYVVEDFAKPIAPKPEPKTDGGGTKPKDDGGASKPKSTPTPTTPKSNPGGGGSASAEQKQAAADEALHYASQLFAGDGDGAPTAVDAAMASRRGSTDMGRDIDAIREGGGKVAIGGPPGDGRGPRDSGPRTGTDSGPGTGPGAGTIASAGDPGRDEKTPGSRVTVSSKKSFDDSTLTVDAVVAKIKSAYMSGLLRCHKDLLKKEPTAAGTVTITFTVNETGKVVRPRAAGFNSELDRCVESRMAAWRFPEPKDTDGEPTDAAFEVKLPFQPQ